MPEPREGVLYPLMVIAAISVILFSLFGIGVMLGYLPTPHLSNAARSGLQVAPSLGESIASTEKMHAERGDVGTAKSDSGTERRSLQDPRAAVRPAGK